MIEEEKYIAVCFIKSCVINPNSKVLESIIVLHERKEIENVILIVQDNEMAQKLESCLSIIPPLNQKVKIVIDNDELELLNGNPFNMDTTELRTIIQICKLKDRQNKQILLFNENYLFTKQIIQSIIEENDFENMKHALSSKSKRVYATAPFSEFTVPEFQKWMTIPGIVFPESFHSDTIQSLLYFNQKHPKKSVICIKSIIENWCSIVSSQAENNSQKESNTLPSILYSPDPELGYIMIFAISIVVFTILLCCFLRYFGIIGFD